MATQLQQTMSIAGYCNTTMDTSMQSEKLGEAIPLGS
jgi:hypothetical protein